MRIAIAGGTGTLGSHITSELTARGHDVRVLSRRSQQYPVDLTSGQGLAATLDGCDVVTDASNESAPRRAIRSRPSRLRGQPWRMRTHIWNAAVSSNV